MDISSDSQFELHVSIEPILSQKRAGMQAPRIVRDCWQNQWRHD